MAATTFGIDAAVDAGSDATYETRFVDALAGSPLISGAAITDIRATLRDVRTNALIPIVAPRDRQNVLNMNGGTLAGDGLFQLRLSGATDNVVISGTAQRGEREQHYLLIEVTHTRAGGQVGYVSKPVFFYVTKV